MHGAEDYLFPSPYGEDKGFIEIGKPLDVVPVGFRPLTGKIKVLFWFCNF